MLLLLCTVARPAFGESYNATPSYMTADCNQNGSGTIFCYSGVVAGLPSVSANGATANLDFAWNFSSYRGGCEDNLQYQSDDERAWTTLYSIAGSNTGVSGLGDPMYFNVNVSNLSSLQFRFQMVASTGGGGGYAWCGGTLNDVSVTPY
jgi:hypothetical protein